MPYNLRLENGLKSSVELDAQQEALKLKAKLVEATDKAMDNFSCVQSNIPREMEDFPYGKMVNPSVGQGWEVVEKSHKLTVKRILSNRKKNDTF